MVGESLMLLYVVPRCVAQPGQWPSLHGKQRLLYSHCYDTMQYSLRYEM